MNAPRNNVKTAAYAAGAVGISGIFFFIFLHDFYVYFRGCARIPLCAVTALFCFCFSILVASAIYQGFILLPPPHPRCLPLFFSRTGFGTIDTTALAKALSHFANSTSFGPMIPTRPRQNKMPPARGSIETTPSFLSWSTIEHPSKHINRPFHEKLHLLM